MSLHLSKLDRNCDTLTSKHDIIILGDFKAKPTDTTLPNFCEVCNLKNLIKEKTCFKNPHEVSCIDLTITNRPKSFQNSMVIETGLFYFQKICITVIKNVL